MGMNDNLTWQQSGWRWLWITAVFIVVDQLTKYWIVGAVTHDIYVLPVLNIIHTVNEGAAWSLFIDLFAIACVVFCVTGA